MRRNSIIILSCLIVLIFAVITNFVSRHVIIKGTNAIEIRDAENDMQRMHEHLRSIEKHASLMVIDWACWDEAYKYVHDRNNDFILNNFDVDSLKKLYISSAAIYDKNTTLLCFVDASERFREPGVPDSELQTFKRVAAIMQRGELESIEGFVAVDGKPLVIAAHKMYDSKKQNPAGGLLVLAATLDQAYLEDTQSLARYNYSILPARAFADIKVDATRDTGVKIVASKDEIRVYSLIYDIFGDAAFCLEFRRDRAVTALGLKMAQQNFLLMLCLGLVILFVGFMVLHRAQLKIMQREVAYRAGHDSLTGLINKSLIPERLSSITRDAHKSGSLVGVVFIHLNRFKDINDSWGHEQGDNLLREAADRLRRVTANGFVARPGGDKFLIVSEASSPPQIAALAEKALERLRAPFAINGNEVHLGASIGIACYPADGEDARLLVHRAELAMHASRSEGENALLFFTGAMESEVSRKMQLESALYSAVETCALSVQYQPKVNVLTRAAVGCEALVRWQRQDGAWVPPPVFIPLAEKCGLVTSIDMFVLRRACRQVKEWESGGYAVPVAVNMSAHSILSEGFAARVTQILREEGVSPALINLEITETCLMSNLDAAFAAFTQLHESGIRIALDDFGTGYSSLQYLSAMPISCLKIDKKFVDDIFSGKKTAQSLVKSILALASNLGMSTVSEGVEDRNQLNFLVANGADVIQGYLFSKPLDGAACGEFLRSSHARISAVMDAPCA